jgi:hypothetical protein
LEPNFLGLCRCNFIFCICRQRQLRLRRVEIANVILQYAALAGPNTLQQFVLNVCCVPCSLWLQEVLGSAPVAPVTTKLECAKLADGAAALVLVPAAAARDNSRGALAEPVPRVF